MREQFATGSAAAGIDPRSFSGRLAAVASERRLSLLLCLGERKRTVGELADLCRFDTAITAEDLELLGRHGLVGRSPDGVWQVCCPAITPAIARLVDLVLSPRPPEENAT